VAAVLETLAYLKHETTVWLELPEYGPRDDAGLAPTPTWTDISPAGDVPFNVLAIDRAIPTWCTRAATAVCGRPRTAG
jgi:hypothetical protein